MHRCKAGRVISVGDGRGFKGFHSFLWGWCDHHLICFQALQQIWPFESLPSGLRFSDIPLQNWREQHPHTFSIRWVYICERFRSRHRRAEDSPCDFQGGRNVNERRFNTNGAHSWITLAAVVIFFFLSFFPFLCFCDAVQNKRASRQ